MLQLSNKTHTKFKNARIKNGNNLKHLGKSLFPSGLGGSKIVGSQDVRPLTLLN
jgi:hypothetical protein